MIERFGLALVRPRAALALAGQRDNAGRAGSDLIVAILALVFATQLRPLIAAIWLGLAVDAALGLRAAVQTLTDALVVDLGFLVVAAVVIWAGAGRRREVGRAFDLACCAVLPLIFVDLAASVVVHGAQLEVPRAVMWLLSGIAYAWTGALTALAIVEARRATTTSARTRAGWVFVALALAGIATQISWLAAHGDRIRPMQHGDPAPPLALPSIAPHGVLADRVSLAPGKVIVLDFWATWCGPCLKALPRLDAFARRHPEVQVLAIDIDDAAEARALFDDRGYALTLLAGDRETIDRYGVAAIPHTVLIDRAGIVRRVFRGGHVDLERELLLLK